ncbi:YHYH protein [Hahella sp. CCB-MM4]|uniref:YHYH protein n=1 Tax=Hahella sp. (strain CCB-MM4) TaxID=1926491 RepID=UPI0011403845|nr:YHYH protein [Hahella sp. CCB-MM4]
MNNKKVETNTRKYLAVFLVLFLAVSGLTACGGGGASSGTSTGDSSTEDASSVTLSSTADETKDVYSAWMINESNETSAVMLDGGAGILVNVQSVTPMYYSGENYAQVEASGIPNYQVTISQDLIDWIEARPRADLADDSQQDLVTGDVTVSAGDLIEFGEDIGYRSFSRDTTCPLNAGYGYWPPGPTCPENTDKIGYFPEAPSESGSDCETGLGVVGYAINGVSIFNWDDGQSYNREDVWHTLAPVAEAYDVDICGGHAANGEYHHHFYSSCWAEVAGDEGNGHSPIYGYAADGYPIYGPWHDTGVVAQSCWKKRDYSASSETGCGTDGERSCQLVDEYDISKGVTTVSRDGPTTSGTYISLSQNSFDTGEGFFREDYYYDPDCSDDGEAYLDEHNGHDHGDYGYHYHLTVTSATDMTPAFPFTFGPTFKGSLSSIAITSCGGLLPGGPG